GGDREAGGVPGWRAHFGGAEAARGASQDLPALPRLPRDVPEDQGARSQGEPRGHARGPEGASARAPHRSDPRSASRRLIVPCSLSASTGLGRTATPRRRVTRGSLASTVEPEMTITGMRGSLPRTAASVQSKRLSRLSCAGAGSDAARTPLNGAWSGSCRVVQSLTTGKFSVEPHILV